MVKSLHQEGIEVILDVVYNHTGEGNQFGPVYSFKGIDNDTYYMLTPRPEEPYANFSGAGNTLNCGNRYVRKMILDSLRYWVEEMHVDASASTWPRSSSEGRTARSTSRIQGSSETSSPTPVSLVRASSRSPGMPRAPINWDGNFRGSPGFSGTTGFATTSGAS